MFTYFWGMGTYFLLGGLKAYIYWGWVEIFGGLIPHPPGFALLRLKTDRMNKIYKIINVFYCFNEKHMFKMNRNVKE